MKRRPLLRWLIVAALCLTPALLYWSTIFQRYGFRDDYSILRESHEEPGKVTLVCAMQARPIFGVLLEKSFAQLRGIDDLPWLRLLAAYLVGAVAACLFSLLRAQKWERPTAALLAGLITVLPGAQLLVSWTVGWPLGVALLLALAAFACGERAFGANPPLTTVQETTNGASGVRKAVWWFLAVLLVAASALVYQSNALFYFVPVAAALWPRRRWVARTAAEWLVRHVLTVVLGLAVAFTVMMRAFAQGSVPTSDRVMLEHDWLGKLGWFLHGPLQNALATIVINDDDGSRLVHRLAALTAVLLFAGCFREWQTRGWRHGAWWMGAIGTLVLASFSVNLMVGDRWPVYRVLLPLTGVILVFLAIAILTLAGRRLARFALLVMLVLGAWLARRQAFDLIAWPQSVELAMLEEGARQIPVNLPEKARVFVVTPMPKDHVAMRVFSDEFGSLSTDSEWVPKEMLKLVMHEQHRDLPNVTSRYAYESGRKPPEDAEYDVVIDLRRVREFRHLPKNTPVDQIMLAEGAARR